MTEILYIVVIIYIAIDRKCDKIEHVANARTKQDFESFEKN